MGKMVESTVSPKVGVAKLLSTAYLATSLIPILRSKSLLESLVSST